MKQTQWTVLLLLAVFIGMIGLLIMQSTQNERPESSPTHENLTENAVDLESGLLFPGILAEDVRVFNILDPVRESQVIVARNDDGLWQVVADDNRLANQEYANSLAVTLEKIPYLAQLDISSDMKDVLDSYGLNERDGLIVVTAVLEDTSVQTFLVGNPVTTDRFTSGFYTLVDGRDTVYVVPPEPIMYLVQYLESFENTQKLDN